MAEKPDPLDVAQLAKKELAETAFPAGGKQDFRVYFERAIHQRIAAHAGEKLALEICGFLVGQWYRDAGGPYVLINEAVRCDKAVSNAGDVTFTHDAWNEVNREMDTKYPERSIVGWYHSHPNFGIFLSDRDQFIQDHTFNSPGQIAYVVDPVNGVEGVFQWRDGKSVPCPHFWVGDAVHLSSQGAARKPSSAPAAGSSSPPAANPEPLPPIMTSVTWVLLAVCLLLLGYLLGTRMSDWQQKMLVNGAVDYYGTMKGLRPGMREDLDDIDAHLQKLIQAADALAVEHVKALPADAQEEKKQEWSQVIHDLQVTDENIRRVNRAYSLTPDESAEVQRLLDAKQAEAAGALAQSPAASESKSSGQAVGAAKPSAAPPAKMQEAKPDAPAKAVDTARPAAPIADPNKKMP